MCGLLVAFSWLVGKQLQSLPSAIGTLLAMLAVSWRNWVPVKFVISPIGVEQSFLRFSRRISWNHFRRCEVRPRGLLLLPDASNSLLGALKGTYIHCGDREGEILELVTTYLQRRRGTGSSVRRRAAS
ncbi:MAG: hypothetical protein CL681_24405 [Blastopirellula sp.]|nr:hypothetical protein [Blastopirellula sp.]